MRIPASARAAAYVLTVLAAIASPRVVQAQSAPASTRPAEGLSASTQPVDRTRGGGAIDPAVYAPADALAFIGVADLDKFLADFARSGIGTIFGDRAAAAAFTEVKDAQALFDDYRGRIARAVGIEPAQLQWPLGGACAAFIYRMKGEAGGGELFLGYGVTLGVRDAATAKEYYARLTTNLKAIALKSDSATSGPDRIDFFVLSAPEAEADEELDEIFAEPTLADTTALLARMGGWRSVAVCLRDERFFAGDSIESVRAMLKREAAGSLAAGRDYAAIDRIFDKPGGLRLLVDVPQGLAIARGLEPQGTKELETLLGADCLRSLIGVFDSGGEKFDTRLEFVALMEGPRSGLAKILSLPNTRTATIGDVPADALYAAEYRIDPAAAFAEFERVINQVSQAGDDARMSVMTQAGEELHLRDDLLNVLRSPQRMVVSLPSSNDPGAARAWLSVEHGDARKLSKWLEYLREIAPLTDRESAGTTVYDLPFNASLAILKDRVVLGTAEAVDALIESAATKTLGDLPEFRRALEVAPAESSVVAYEDTARLMRACAAIGMEPGALPALFLQKPAVAAVYYVAAMGYVGAVGPGFKEKIEPWARLCQPQIQTLATTPDGLRASAFILKPAQQRE